LRGLSRHFGSLTSLLRRISEERGVPLSTLKSNARTLRDLGLIEVDDRRGAQLTRLGRLVLGLLSDGGLLEGVDVARLRSLSESLKCKLSRSLEHIGGLHEASSLSCLDILVALLEGWLRLRVLNPAALVLSKGHAAPALYVAMSEYGLIDERELASIGELGSRLQTHAEPSVPLVAVPTGSLGQGLSVANGIAMALRLDGRPGTVYVLLGDGELDEGQVWEAAATASSYGLDNVVAIVDRNGRQLSGPTEAVKRKEPLKARWESFGWSVEEVDGHDHGRLLRALAEAELFRSGRPKVIIARTAVS